MGWGGLLQRSGSLGVPRLLYYAGLAFIGAVSFRPVSVTISDILFFAALIAVGIEVLGGRLQASFELPRWLLYGLAVFTVGGLASSLASAHRMGSLLALGRFVYIILVWFWLGTVVLRTLHSLYTAVAFWTFSVAAVGLSAVVQLFWTKLPGACDPQYCNFGGDTRFLGRMAGFTQAPNDLGGMAAVALIPALMMALRPRISIQARILAGAFLLLTVVGLILSGSVAAMLAASLAVVLWVLFSRFSRRQLATLAIIGGTVILVVGLQSAVKARSPLQRIADVLAAKDPNASLNSRVRIDQATLESIGKTPVVGVGLDANSADDKLVRFGFKRGLGVHNLFLAAWLGGGILALVGLLLIVWTLLRLGYATIRSGPVEGDDRRLAVALWIALITFMVFGIASPTLYLRYGWVSAALLVAQAAVRQRTVASSQPLLRPSAVAP